MPATHWTEEHVPIAGTSVHITAVVTAHRCSFCMVRVAIRAGFRILIPMAPPSPCMCQASRVLATPRHRMDCQGRGSGSVCPVAARGTGLGPVHLLGHGVGGWLAADVATLCPQVIERLVLVDAMGIKPHNTDILDISSSPPQRCVPGPSMILHRCPNGSACAVYTPTAAEAERAEEALEMLMRICWKPYMYEPRLPFLLPRIKHSTLIVWGRQDAIVPLECAERYYQGIADSQLTVLDACGHYPQLEKPHDFTTAVRSFLSVS